MPLPPCVESAPSSYVIPETVKQHDVPQLVRYLKSMYTKIEAKQKVNNLQSNGRLEQGVHDNLQIRLDRMHESAFADEIILFGGKHKTRSRRYKKRSSRKTRTKTRTKRKNAATRRR